METVFFQNEDSLADVLNLPRGMSAIVGGGGKTTLMLRLAQELADRGARVIVTTTTHIVPPERLVTLTNASVRQVRDALERARAVCLGKPSKEGKLSAPDLAMNSIQRLADYVLVEADGAKHLPLKAPAGHEPAIPPETRLVIAVAGMDGLGKPIKEAVFRPGLYAALCGKAEEEIVSAEDIARILIHEEGQRKGVSGDMRFAVLLNKADDATKQSAARDIASYLQRSPVERVVIASLGAHVAG
ncbi:MAG: selenium cofactor biosynthesis protein YqeC [Christensenella sp.]|nr:selenium cofactor biosynthesis protein YqeC [Christensenella sp.]